MLTTSANCILLLHHVGSSQKTKNSTCRNDTTGVRYNNKDQFYNFIKRLS